MDRSSLACVAPVIKIALPSGLLTVTFGAAGGSTVFLISWGFSSFLFKLVLVLFKLSTAAINWSLAVLSSDFFSLEATSAKALLIYEAKSSLSSLGFSAVFTSLLFYY